MNAQPDPPVEATVVAIIAAFKPEPCLAATVAGMADHFSHVVVVDDGSPGDFAPVLSAAESAGAIVLRRGENEGIAAALNAGIGLVRDRWDPDYLVTFDQDSTPVPDYAHRAVDTYRAARAAGVSAGFVVAASYSGHPARTRATIHGFAVALDPMQSGFVIPRETFAALGTFDEGYVIDGVDSEFTARARTAGLVAIIGMGCDLQHDLGRRSDAILFGRPVRVLGHSVSYNYHSPTRVFYISRNGTVLTGTYLRADPTWVLRRLIEETLAHILRLTFSPNRRVLVTAMLAGVRAGIGRRMGRIPEDLVQRLA